MTTRPKLRVGRHLLPGLIAAGLFVLFAVSILRSEFAEPMGFPEEASVVGNIGLALLNIEGAIPAEGFLVALIAIAVVLDAALGGAVMLASRDEEADEGGDA